MKIKTLFVVFGLLVLPASGYAMCSGHDHQALSCAEGTVWNADTQTCVAQVTG
ncbi:MAG: adenylosuccinate lyase [Rhodobiaceae bacterium]|jgi:hypothetical protein|nr:adenylosuccinate lyase [Rhodobiaceae bacterium]